MACAPSTFPSFPCVAVPSGCDLSVQPPTVQKSAFSLLSARANRTEHMLKAPNLSSRGQSHEKKVTPFWDVFDRIIGNAYCSKNNPKGTVNMAISNNYLLESELLDFFSSNLQMMPTDLTYGTSLFGSHRLFASLCKHFNSAIFRPVMPLQASHLITGPGCGPLLDQVFEHLCEPEDGVLIAAPYYNGYDADLSCRSHVRCVPVWSAHDDGSPSINFEGPTALREFEQSKQIWETQNSDHAVKAVIICNPHNPVGRCYDRDALIEYGRFAEKHDLHLVFDEIFAASTFHSATDTEQPQEPFHSALSIDWAVEASCHPARIHVVWSASKDFGVNGLRVGTLISQSNPELLRAMKATAKLYMVSSPADALFCAMVDNEKVYNEFIAINQKRMASAYDTVVRWCQHHTIAYTPCNAGHFLLIDLERFLPSEIDGKSIEGASREGALWAHFLDHAVCLTPGSNYHHPHLGTFRLTFTLGRTALLEGLRRIEEALDLPHWQDHLVEEECVFSNMTLSPQSEEVKQRETTQPHMDSEEAVAERHMYSDAIREMLREGGGRDELRICGMGMPCAC